MMFMVLIKYVKNNGKTVWGVEGNPYNHLVDAVTAAKKLAEDTPNTFAVVEFSRMYRRTVAVVEVEVAP